jgi:DNA polymerase III delta' subunit
MEGARMPAGHGTFLTQGHAAALEVVARAVQRERPPHALLIAGPRGIGKTTLAIDLAAGLLCLADPLARPCRSCPACRKVEAGNHPDLHVVGPDGAGEQIRLGQVQQLGSDLALTAMEGRFRVAVITSAHRLNPDAQNALLKTLEEPGPATCLVLCADDTAPLLPTLLSRAARLRLAPLAVEALTDWLVEGGHADPATARAVAITAGGRPGLALTLARQPEAMLTRAELSRTLLALLDADRRTRLSSAPELLSAGLTVDAAMRGELASASSRPQPSERRRAVALVVDVWRDLGRDLLVTLHGGARMVRDRDRLAELEAAAPGIEAAVLRGFLERLDRFGLAVEAYASPELVLDVLLLAWARPRRSPGAAAA